MNRLIVNFLLCLVLIVTNAVAQNETQSFPKRYNPAISIDLVASSSTVYELMPHFLKNVVLSASEREYLDNLIKTKYPQGDFVYPYSINSYPETDIQKILSIESFEIQDIATNEIYSSKSELITADQKKLLNSINLGALSKITVHFKYLGETDNKKIINGDYYVSIIPTVEANFPGGHDKMAEFFNNNVINLMTNPRDKEIIWRSEVKFKIDENGNIKEVKLINTTSDLELDKLVIAATNRMPKWIPAKNSDGNNVEQEVVVRFMRGC